MDEVSYISHTFWPFHPLPLHMVPCGGLFYVIYIYYTEDEEVRKRMCCCDEGVCRTPPSPRGYHTSLAQPHSPSRSISPLPPEARPALSAPPTNQWLRRRSCDWSCDSSKPIAALWGTGKRRGVPYPSLSLSTSLSLSLSLSQAVWICRRDTRDGETERALERQRG